MSLKFFSTISMTCSVNFLMFLSSHILMISWSTCSCYPNTENMYTWYSNVWRKLTWCDIKKCKFYMTEVIYLDLIISCDDIKMNFVKMKTIISWKNLNNVHDVQSFLDFVNFYQQFIKHFLKIVQSLVNLIKKDTKFLWNAKCKHMFNDLKNWFTTASILAHFNSDLKCVLETDSSDHALESVLLQYDENDVLCSVIYFSQKLNAAELNYEIYDKKLLVIIWCFEQ